MSVKKYYLCSTEQGYTNIELEINKSVYLRQINKEYFDGPTTQDEHPYKYYVDVTASYINIIDKLHIIVSNHDFGKLKGCLEETLDTFLGILNLPINVCANDRLESVEVVVLDTLFSLLTSENKINFNIADIQTILDWGDDHNYFLHEKYLLMRCLSLSENERKEINGYWCIFLDDCMWDEGLMNRYIEILKHLLTRFTPSNYFTGLLRSTYRELFDSVYHNEKVQ